ncbi:MAG: 3-hydroxyacyl-CoA dehydrogenase [Phycisphaeraceae bacterium]|nr:3-hydroxyacyl-CoA dehydrogenase [Phycisphaeraceae bacterium]
MNHVTVIGLGTMGHGIAQAFAACGCRVRTYDAETLVRESALDRIRTNLDAFQEAGLLDAPGAASILERIEIHDDEIDALKDAQFVTEAVVERLDVKQALFARIEGHVSDDCILTSNTSSFPMTQIGRDMRRPTRALNTHWFNPPHIVPLVEVVPGEHTEEPVVAATMDLLRRAGKTAIRLNREVPGFLVNRVQIAMLRELVDMIERGVASAEDIDEALRASIGFRMAAIGQLLVNDFAGLDVVLSVYRNLIQDMKSDREPHDLVKRLVADGDFGAKTGAGLFSYEDHSVEDTMAVRDRRYLELLKLRQADRL